MLNLCLLPNGKWEISPIAPFPSTPLLLCVCPNLGVSRGRVCYQRGYPVLLHKHFFSVLSYYLNSICYISGRKAGLKLSQTMFVLRGIRAYTVRSSFSPASTGWRPAGQDFCACAVAAAQVGQEDQSLSNTTVTLKNRRVDPT